jgi:hypothetical protein
MRRFSTFLIILACTFLSKGQEIVKRCALDDIIQQDLLRNSTLASTYLRQINQSINNIVAYDSTLANTDSVYTVQVVFHIVYLANNKYENIPDEIVQSQIDELNTAYNALNADSVNLRPFFIPFRGNAKIKFQLATTAPNGQPTNGITRTQGKLGNLAGWDPISTLVWTALGVEPLKEDFFLFTGSTGKSPWPASKYLNIYVCDLNHASRKCPSCLTLCDTCGALGGFAYPPSNAINWGALALDHGKNDGVVIDFRFFGQNNYYAQDSTSQRFRDFYAQGKSTVHEVGHYLGLQHSWGNVVNLPGLPYTDGCTVDDFIDDTPEELQQFSANLQQGFTNPCDSSINSCDKTYLGVDYPDMYEDYMDYSTDACYNLFTKQQVNLMRYNLLTRRPGIIVKRELAPSIPTAVRNIKAETGISIYPNPATNILSVHYDQILTKDLMLEIFDVSGKLVASEPVSKASYNTTMDVSAFAKGLYFARFHNSEISVTDKFVIE